MKKPLRPRRSHLEQPRKQQQRCHEWLEFHLHRDRQTERRSWRSVWRIAYNSTCCKKVASDLKGGGGGNGPCENLCQLVDRHPVARIFNNIDFNHTAGVIEQRTTLGAQVLKTQFFTLPKIALCEATHCFEARVITDP